MFRCLFALYFVQRTKPCQKPGQKPRLKLRQKPIQKPVQKLKKCKKLFQPVPRLPWRSCRYNCVKKPQDEFACGCMLVTLKQLWNVCFLLPLENLVFPVELQTVLLETADICNERPVGSALPRADGSFTCWWHQINCFSGARQNLAKNSQKIFFLLQVSCGN